MQRDGDLPVVSIGLPVWNGAGEIARALTSLLGQSYARLELIISDNASTDQTGEVCQEFQRSDPRIQYFRQDSNIGALENFRFAYQKASGEYFFWAPHDDCWDIDFVKRGVEALRENGNASCAFGSVIYIHKKTGENFLRYDPPYQLDNASPARRMRSYFTNQSKIPDQVVYSLFRTETLKDYVWAKSLCPEKKIIAHLILRGSVADVPGMNYTSYYLPKTPDEAARILLIEDRDRDWMRLKQFLGVAGELYDHLSLLDFIWILPLYIQTYSWHRHFAQILFRRLKAVFKLQRP